MAAGFAAEGVALILFDRAIAPLEELAQQLGAQGCHTLPLAADVTSETDLAAAIGTAEQHFGRIDVLFNNAGIGGLDATAVDMDARQWDTMLDINLRGIFLSCKYGVPPLVRAGGGAIVNMGSSTGRHDTLPGSSAYMASKAGVEAFSRSLALQVAPHIRVNTICPGIIETPLSIGQKAGVSAESFFARFAARIPLGRVGRPADVAAVVAFLASDQARGMTGTALLLDGGQTLRRWISAPDLVH